MTGETSLNKLQLDNNTNTNTVNRILHTFYLAYYLYYKGGGGLKRVSQNVLVSYRNLLSDFPLALLPGGSTFKYSVFVFMRVLMRYNHVFKKSLKSLTPQGQ